MTTARSLLSLMETADFTEATFLLSVLGEGTFLDLLRFIEDHAGQEVVFARRIPDDRAPRRAARARSGGCWTAGACATGPVCS